jgi:S-formylglutathione hydrolase FrmB
MSARFWYVIPGILASGMATRPMADQEQAASNYPIRVSIQVDQSRARTGNGRLIIAIAPASNSEPLRGIGNTDPDAWPLVGIDWVEPSGGQTVPVDLLRATHYPIGRLSKLPPGLYRAQALLHRNRDLNYPGAPGDLKGAPVSFEVKADAPQTDPATITLGLNEAIGPEIPPGNESDPFVRSVIIDSPKLSAFHGRPMQLRAGVILPKGFHDEPRRRYPMRIHVGGYATRYSSVSDRMEERSRFRALWLARDTPRFVLVQLDGMGPYGDPYQVDSANHGPYGQAIMTELLPEIETRFRCGGEGSQRVIDGGSTGGWVSLALQIYYPDAFAGCWSACPDPVDFRHFQDIDIYQDQNAYLTPQGSERPACRVPATGKMRYSMRHECQLENVQGWQGSWANAGGQWAAWNAAFGPRGEDGLPRPLWDPVSGQIDRAVLDHWRQYDLRLRLETNWAELGPRLRGKIRIWVGEQDDFFLERAVRRLEAFLRTADPPADAQIHYGPGRGHCWLGISEAEMMREMAAVTGAHP